MKSFADTSNPSTRYELYPSKHIAPFEPNVIIYFSEIVLKKISAASMFFVCEKFRASCSLQNIIFALLVNNRRRLSLKKVTIFGSDSVMTVFVSIFDA